MRSGAILGGLKLKVKKTSHILTRKSGIGVKQLKLAI